MSRLNYEPLRRVPVPVNDSSTNSGSLLPPHQPHSRESSLTRSDISSSSSFVYSKPAKSSNSSTKNATRANMHGYNTEKVTTVTGSKKKRSWRDCLSLESFSHGWSIEILSSIMSLAALIAIIILLKKYDQQTIPHWPLGITLNTLLAFLTAVSQAGFVNPVLQGLSQMKWNWFVDKDRPLVDFENFDNASRGSWGSFLLLINTKGRLSILMATVILVSSTITSTVTQAVLTQDTRYLSSDGTALLYTMLNDWSSPTTIDTLSFVVSPMMTSVNSTYEYSQPICTSGNCRYPNFSSLAICAETSNITDKLVAQSNFTQAGLTLNKDLVLTPGEQVTMNISSISLDIMSELAPKFNESWAKVYSFSNDTFGDNALVAIQMIYQNISTILRSTQHLPVAADTTIDMPFLRAAEVLFYMCVETYDVTTTNGTTLTNVTSTKKTVDIMAEEIQYTQSVLNYPILEWNRTFVVDGRNYTYSGPDIGLANILGNMLTGEFDGFVEFNMGLGNNTLFTYATGEAIYNNYKIAITEGAERDQIMFQTIDTVVKNIARGLTNWIRLSYPSPVQGQNYVLDTYVIVRWPFITCLSIQVVLSIIFLVWIMLDTRIRKVEIMKESALATLFAVHSQDKITLENRLSLLNEKNAIAEVGASSRANLMKGPFGQWHLKLSR